MTNISGAMSLIADAMRNCLVSPNESDSNGEIANAVDGLFAIARALDHVAIQLKYLGNGDAATPMGAIENLAKEIHDGFADLSSSLDGIGERIGDLKHDSQ